MNDRVGALEDAVEGAGVTQVTDDDLGAERTEEIGSDRVADQHPDGLPLLEQARDEPAADDSVAPVTRMVMVKSPKLDVLSASTLTYTLTYQTL